MSLRSWFSRRRRPEHGPTRLIVGLGNPGDRYAHTRHNIGFVCIDELATRHQLRFNTKRAHSLVAHGEIKRRRVALAKPQTYMNESGLAVQQLMTAWGIPMDAVLVVYDDVDLPAGVLRLRARGSAGTHNGMRSIVERVSNNFPRMRIGVGTPAGGRDLAAYVLSKPNAEDSLALREAVERACEAIEVFIEAGTDEAMNRFNR